MASVRFEIDWKKVFGNVSDLTTQMRCVRDVLTERERQDGKWGQQNHNPVEWMPILGEEYGELCKEVNECYFANVKASENLYKEACETAAVALAIMECCLRNEWEDQTGSWKEDYDCNI